MIQVKHFLRRRGPDTLIFWNKIDLSKFLWQGLLLLEVPPESLVMVACLARWKTCMLLLGGSHGKGNSH